MAAASPFLVAAEYLPMREIVAVKQFAADNGLEAMHYNPVTNTWQFTDGEPYTTSAILKHQARP